MEWFWAIYRWFWWRVPSNRKKYRELLGEALRDNKFTFTLRHVTDHDWYEKIREEGGNRYGKDVKDSSLCRLSRDVSSRAVKPHGAVSKLCCESYGRG